MVQVVTYTPVRGGLNNQKLALLGLVKLAKREGYAVSIPMLSDYRGETLSASLVPFGSVYEEDQFVSFLKRFGVAVSRADPTITLRSWDCFSNAFTEVDGDNDAKIPEHVTSFILSLRLTSRLQSVVDGICRKLDDLQSEPIGCQLRVEKDWKAHTQTLATRVKSGTIQLEDFGIGAPEILSKVRRTPDLQNAKILYAALDQYQLSESLPDLKERARLLDFELWCKTDFEFVDLAALTRIDASCVDFEVCRRCNVFVGNTRSTFANLMALTHYADHGESESVRDYIYNALEQTVIQRRDHGLKHSAVEAIRPF